MSKCGSWSSQPKDSSDREWRELQKSATPKISCWAVSKDAPGRPGSWEVSHAAEDGKGCCTVLFAGPKARQRAEWYRDMLVGEELLK